MTPPLFELCPTETWDLFEFLMTPPVGNFCQILPLFNFEGSPKQMNYKTGLLHRGRGHENERQGNNVLNKIGDVIEGIGEDVINGVVDATGVGPVINASNNYDDILNNMI